MISYKMIILLGVALVMQLTTAAPQNPREFINFGSPFENPPDVTRTVAQIEADLVKESSQNNIIDPSILAELDRTNQPVIRSFIDETGNTHTLNYTKNPDGTITKQQSGTVLINEANRNVNQVPGVGMVPIDELLQGTGEVNTVYTDDNVKRTTVYRLKKNDEAAEENFIPINTNVNPIVAPTPRPQHRVPATTRRAVVSTTTTTTPAPIVNAERQPTIAGRQPATIAEQIFNDLNKIFESYLVQRDNENLFELFRPTLLRPQEFFNIPAYVRNPNKFNHFDYAEELKPDSDSEWNSFTKDVRIASDGKTIASVRYLPSNNLIFSRTPTFITTIKTRAGHQIVTKARQMLGANRGSMYLSDGLAEGIFYKGI